MHEARAKEMLRSHLDGRIAIADVADACQLSRSHFTRAFRLATGHTPHDWLQAQRLARARELLRASDLPLAEVATACGFADQSHFTRVFSRAEGAPPGQWRRALQT
jgi:transcriptional regulator GlxA family with amidase domain